MIDIDLIVGGRIWKGWSSVTITRSVEAIAGAFSLSVSGAENADLQVGQACELRFEGQTIVKGHINRANTSISADDVALSLVGRDATGDLVDCSPELKGQRLNDVTLRDVVKTLTEPFPVSGHVRSSTGEAHKVNLKNATVFEVIEKLCRTEGLLIMPDGAGGFVIDKPATRKASYPLVMGENILSADIQTNDEGRFSRYTATGQGAVTNSASASVEDKNVSRHRPHIFQPSGRMDERQIQQRVEWEATIRAARSQSITVRVAGWRQGMNEGELWDVNQLVEVKIPQRGIESTMLIKSLTLSHDGSQGTTTSLQLVHPDSYARQPEISKKALL